ncbi:NTP transferase domain-containing protein [Croceicoccus hydrothermalis]|uniref:NTP transferase domain-containing protein n=1 Tax=Croceicoccus hydrothermalis TaxID=2867964 RepID=UPI001EFB1FDB|nr:NTP transferase domain-containing protein [Croceicoccus hydrothermalis]
MSHMPVTVLMLAAQRTGVVNPLAREFDVSHKCLVPICGAPLITHVLETLSNIPDIAEVRISIEADAHDAVGAVVAPYDRPDRPVRLVPSQPGIVDSVIAASEGDEGPFIITTADNVLLTREGFDAMRDAMHDADAAAGLATRERVLAAHPEGQRRFYELKDAGYANCNIYALANRKAFAAAEVFREGGQFMNNPSRMVRAFGVVNILLMRAKLITLDGAMKRLGRKFGIRMKGVSFTDGALAIDVDNRRTYDIAQPILSQRLHRADETQPHP